MSEPPERKPIYRCRRIDPAHVDLLENEEETIRDTVKSAIQSGVLQVYSVYRFDDHTQTFAVYHPTKHALILLYEGETITTKDIPSMHIGLKWWIQEPDIWKEHIISN